MSHNYSETYNKQLNDLAAWFKERLSRETMPNVVLTEGDYSIGVDALRDPFTSLIKEAFEKWFHERKYELSRSDYSSAFFSAARACGKLILR